MSDTATDEKTDAVSEDSDSSIVKMIKTVAESVAKIGKGLGDAFGEIASLGEEVESLESRISKVEKRQKSDGD